jgi:hypothetical protein
MDLEFDIFEVCPDGSVEWRESVAGESRACIRMQELAVESHNEFFAVHVPTGRVAARVNTVHGRKTSWPNATR